MRPLFDGPPKISFAAHLPAHAALKTSYFPGKLLYSENLQVADEVYRRDLSYLLCLNLPFHLANQERSTLLQHVSCAEA